MKNIQIILLAFIAAFIATSCTIEHTVDFNEDFSGSNSFHMDMSEMMTMMKAMQPDSAAGDVNSMLGDYDMDSEMQELEKEFDKTEGLTNLEFIDRVEEGVLGMSFDFEDVKYITQGMSKADTEDKLKDSNDLFVLGKNSLEVNFSSSSFTDAFAGDKEDTEEDMMGGFSMGDYALTLNFPFEIKSVDNENYMLSEDRKSVSFVMPLEAFSDKNIDLNTVIKW